MKYQNQMKIILLLLLNITSILVFSQNYHPFLKTTTWYEKVYDWGGGFVFTYQHEGQHIIQGITYEMIKVNDSNPKYFFLREDTTARRVFIIRDTLTSLKEDLLYDFSLNEGDIFKPGPVFGVQDSFMVLKVDSILTNGGLRKQTNIKRISTDELVWLVEGVGSLEEPFLIMNFYTDPGFQLLCSYEDEQNIYQSNITGCQPPTSTNHQLRYNKMKISPNPNNGNFKLYSDERGTLNITCFDQYGRIIGNFSTYYQSYITNSDFNFGDIPKGLYFLQIQSDSGNSIIKMMVE